MRNEKGFSLPENVPSETPLWEQAAVTTPNTPRNLTILLRGLQFGMKPTPVEEPLLST